MRQSSSFQHRHHVVVGVGWQSWGITHVLSDPGIAYNTLAQLPKEEEYLLSDEDDTYILSIPIREGFKKSKWKFKMAFAMKGGGISVVGFNCLFICF